MPPMADNEPLTPPSAASPNDEELAGALANWLTNLRWFGGKGQTITASRILSHHDLGGPWVGPGLLHLVVGVQLDDDAWQVYQTPLLLLAAADPTLERRFIQRLGSWYAYDALGDPLAPGLLLADVADHPEVDPALTHGSGSGLGPQLQAVWDPHGYVSEPARALSVEQSKTSIMFGSAAMMKVFRRLIPGVNPDVEVSARLGEVGCSDIAQIKGWVNGAWEDPITGETRTGHLAMVQELLSPAVDGWDLSRERVGAGADFTAESYRLGLATGRVHHDLRACLPSHVLSADEVAGMVQRLHARLDSAAAVVPEILTLAPALHQMIDRISELRSPILVQRVHGDYHLGQVLLASDGWKLLDFEGEPGGEIAARVVPDHPLRDVAAMLRSYVYAAQLGGADRDPEDVVSWQEQCQAEFLAGYRDATEADPSDPAAADSDAQAVLLAAYTVDKTAYEAIYEKRNRPDWLEIPMSALRRLAGRTA